MNKSTRVWRKDFENCPLNKRVHILGTFVDNGHLMEFVGTLMINPYTGVVGRGECLEGDPELFYRMKWVYWAEYRTNEEAEAFSLCL